MNNFLNLKAVSSCRHQVPNDLSCLYIKYSNLYFIENSLQTEHLTGHLTAMRKQAPYNLIILSTINLSDNIMYISTIIYQIKLNFESSPLSIIISWAVILLLITAMKNIQSAISSESAHLFNSVSLST